MSEAVLDASAILALLNEEPGSDAVATLLPRAVVTSVNLAEVVGKLADAGMPETAIREAIGALGLSVVPLDAELAYAAGMLRSSTRSRGLSLGDRVCLAVAMRLGVPAITADRLWVGAVTGVEVQAIR